MKRDPPSRMGTPVPIGIEAARATCGQPGPADDPPQKVAGVLTQRMRAATLPGLR